jgi:hypothetical protein
MTYGSSRSLRRGLLHLRSDLLELPHPPLESCWLAYKASIQLQSVDPFVDSGCREGAGCPAQGVCHMASAWRHCMPQISHAMLAHGSRFSSKA